MKKLLYIFTVIVLISCNKDREPLIVNLSADVTRKFNSAYWDVGVDASLVLDSEVYVQVQWDVYGIYVMDTPNEYGYPSQIIVNKKISTEKYLFRYKLQPMYSQNIVSNIMIKEIAHFPSARNVKILSAICSNSNIKFNY